MTIPIEKFIKMPVSELITPEDGRMVYCNRWWCVTENDEVLFFRSYVSPQCNSDKRLVDRLCKMKPFKTEAKFISVAYVPIDWDEFYRD